MCSLTSSKYRGIISALLLLATLLLIQTRRLLESVEKHQLTPAANLF